MPQMKSIDEPSDSGRATFTSNLTEALSTIIDLLELRRIDVPLPDTARITWDALAARIIENKN